MLRPADVLQNEDGLTLVELMIVLLILGVVGAIATTAMIDALGVTRRSEERVDALAELQTASRRVAREIRVADGLAYPLTADGEILAGDDDSIQLDVYRDGNRIRFDYWLEPASAGQPAQLRERARIYGPGPGGPISDTERLVVDRLNNGSSGIPIFTYFDDAGVAAGDADGDGSPDAPASVLITLERDLPEQQPITVTTSAGLRNARG